MTMIQEAISFIINNLDCTDEVQKQFFGDEYTINVSVDGGAFSVRINVSQGDFRFRTYDALNLVAEHNCVYIEYFDDAYKEHMNVLKSALIG